MLMQYCYSADWDYNSKYDPFMTLAVPTEQYVNYTVFNVPGYSSKIDESFANLIVDAKDTDIDLLKTIRIDGEALYNYYPELLLNKITGEDLYWLRLPLKQGNHIIEGDLKFGSCLYGFGEYISYGHTTSLGFKPINNDGNPKITINEIACGEYLVSITDSTGISSLSFDNNSNISCDTTGFYNIIEKYNYQFLMTVDDINQNVNLAITATDILGYNSTKSFTFPEEVRKYYNLQLVKDKDIYDLNDTIKIDIIISSNSWDIYNLDSFSIDINLDSKMYEFFDFKSNLTDDFEVNVNYDSKTSLLNLEFISESGSIGSNVNLGTLECCFLWGNDVNPKMTAQVKNSPYSTRCISFVSDTTYTALQMCASDLFAFNIGDKYSAAISSKNPAKDMVVCTLTVPFETTGDLALFDTQGNLVKSIYLGTISDGTTEFEANIKDIPSGVYFLKVKAGLLAKHLKIYKID